MHTAFTVRLQRRWLGGLLGIIVMITSVGCQTFSLSEEDFQRQQQGQTVDGETGAAVGVVGSVGACGALLGKAVAEALGK